jgi:hypothetical protein
VYTLKIKNKEGKFYYPKTKKRFLAITRGELDKRGQIYAIVGYGKGLYNHGTFTTYKDAKQFVDECTEPNLIKYAQNWT